MADKSTEQLSFVRISDIKDLHWREMALEVSAIFYNILTEMPDFDEIIKKPVSYRLTGKNSWIGELMDFIIKKPERDCYAHLWAAETVKEHSGHNQLAMKLFIDALELAPNCVVLDDIYVMACHSFPGDEAAIYKINAIVEGRRDLLFD